jgi:SAM-dependent methyltransferase
MREIHEANRDRWNSTASDWQLLDEDGWRRCATEPGFAFEGEALEVILELMGELAGKRVCVVGSGDNYAAFALAGLGAAVTSVDIAERRLEIAATRAAELGLEIEFVRADAADLGLLAAGGFDLAVSTNGFFVWLTDLRVVFAEIARLVRPGGCYVFYDVHPFQRPWKDQVWPLEMVKSYWDPVPYELRDREVAHEHHWTMAEIMDGLVASGWVVRRVVESPTVNSRFWEGASYGSGKDESLQDWRRNPRAGLPVWLTVGSSKG